MLQPILRKNTNFSLRLSYIKTCLNADIGIDPITAPSILEINFLEDFISRHISRIACPDLNVLLSCQKSMPEALKST